MSAVVVCKFPEDGSPESCWTLALLLGRLLRVAEAVCGTAMLLLGSSDVGSGFSDDEGEALP